MDRDPTPYPDEERADPAFQYDSVIWTIVHECAMAAARVALRPSSIDRERLEREIWKLPDAYVERILEMVEKVVDSRLAGRLPRRGMS